MDIRLAQIAIMAALLCAGAWLRDFSIEPIQVLGCFAAGITTQWLWLRFLGLKEAGYLSAVITCIGTSLLLRSAVPWAHAAAVCFAISSKFLFRARGKHLFNPANIGVLAAVAFLPQCWISAGQWGSDIAILVWLTALGSFVAANARMNITSWSFIAGYMGIWYVHRILWLGYDFAVWLHQLQSGALLLFTFFMISDPKTSPDHPRAKVIHALTVGLLAYLWQFYFYLPNSLLYALILCAPLVPILDMLFVAPKHRWRPTDETPVSFEAAAEPAVHIGSTIRAGNA